MEQESSDSYPCTPCQDKSHGYNSLHKYNRHDSCVDPQTEREVEDVRELMQNITASFIRFIFEEGSPLLRRLVWCCIWLTCCGYALFNIQSALTQYFKYETASQLSFVQSTDPGGLPMPAITICNMNKYRKSWLTGNFSVVLKYEEEKEWGASSIPITRADNEIANRLFVDEVEKLGKHDIDDMFGEVLFDGEDIMFQPNWKETFLAQPTELGVCYTFNADGKRKVKGTGKDYGATFTININQTEYSDTQESAGIKVMLHDYRVPALIKEYGLAIPPGSEAFISTRALELHNIGEPYANSNCTKRPLSSSPHYSVVTCNLECYAEILYEKCGCKPSYMPLRHIPVCDLYTHRVCIEGEVSKIHKGEYADRITGCECIDSCNSTSYQCSLSRAGYPSINSARNIVKDFLNDSSRFASIKESIRDNYIRLHVYFETLAVERVNKVPAYTTMNLLGDVGGNLGLFIGANVATLAEIADYLARLAHRKFMNRC